MKKATLGLFSVLFVLSLAVAQPVAAQKSKAPPEAPLFGADRALLISPQAILLDETKALGVVEITIHADIAYSYFTDPDVETTVELGGILADRTFADDRGDLVAKFDWDDVAGLFEPGESDFLTLTLVCTADGEEIFSGEDQVRVVY